MRPLLRACVVEPCEDGLATRSKEELDKPLRLLPVRRSRDDTERLFNRIVEACVDLDGAGEAVAVEKTGGDKSRIGVSRVHELFGDVCLPETS